MKFKNPISFGRRFTSILLRIVSKALKIQVEIRGEENIPKDKAILFCANHFTRFETLFLPYLLTKIDNLKYTRSLVYKDLFFGKIKEYLASVKAVSTGDQNRDKIIIDDLVSGKYNWMIYPEGKMMKDKKIFTSKPRFYKTHKMLKVSAKTGSSTLALKAEMQSKTKGKICICPITISYSPIYAKKNNLYLLIKGFLNKPNTPKRVKHEIFFESSILSYSTIIIQFHKPVLIKDYIDSAFFIPKKFQIEYLRYRLINDVMRVVYKNTLLTFDHFFAFCIFSLASKNVFKIELLHLKEIMFNIISNALILKKDLNFAKSMSYSKILSLTLQDSKCEMLDNALQELEIKNLGIVKNNFVFLDREELLKEREFIEIRLKNIFKVLFNEFSYFTKLNQRLEKVFEISWNKLKKHNGELMFKMLEEDYLEERSKSFKHPHDISIGMPILNYNSEVGILLCHGFKSAPLEMQNIQSYFNSKNFSTYSMRLKGHGTTAEEMKKCTKDDWLLYHSFASEAMFRVCKQVFVCGFSMGGLISLINSTKFNYSGLITISTPFKISDFRFYFAGFVDNLLTVVRAVNKDVKDYIISPPENPNINYKKIYFVSLKELNKLIKDAKQKLKSINAPSLIVQGCSDTVVINSSGKDIHDGIQSTDKQLFEFEAGKRHVITMGKESNIMLEKMLEFVNKRKTA